MLYILRVFSISFTGGSQISTLSQVYITHFLDIPHSTKSVQEKGDSTIFSFFKCTPVREPTLRTVCTLVKKKIVNHPFTIFMIKLEAVSNVKVLNVVVV